MNRGALSRRGGVNANVSRSTTGALANRARPGNNQGLTGSRAHGTLGRAGNTINGNLALNTNRAGATNPINGNFSLNTSPVGNGSAVGNGYGTQAIRPLGSNFFGSGLGNSSYGYGNSGYGYGGNGYGFGGGGYGGGGFGNGNSVYVSVYLPGVGWVLVPIWAIRGF